MSTADKLDDETAMNTPRGVAGARKSRAPMDALSATENPEPTAGSAMLEELQATGFIGMWTDREDMKDSTAFVEHLREQIERRADGVTMAE